MANLTIIRELCKDKKITLSELSEKINISYAGMQRILSTNSTKIDTLEKIADVLNVPISSFFDESKKNQLKQTQSELFSMIILDNPILELLSNKYVSFIEKLNLYKDVYIYNILEGIRLNISVFCYDPNTKKNIVTVEQKEEILALHDKYKTTPYSTHWTTEDKSKIANTLILLGFYLIIFQKNFMNIKSYLEDNEIKNVEILSYWKQLKNVDFGKIGNSKK